MADQKITELTATTAPLPTDILPIVTDPGGTPATKKVTAKDLALVTFHYGKAIVMARAYNNF